jgi:hypothetical protein
MTLTIQWEATDVQRDPDGGDLLDQTSTSVEIDLVLDYTYNVGGEQTKRPVEAGAPTSDHWMRQLDNVTISLAHTDTPPNSSSDIQVQAVSVGGSAQAAMGVLTDGGAVSRIRALETDLWALIHSGSPVTITGLSRVLTDYRILTMSVPRESGRAGLMAFTLTAEEIRTATLETVGAPAPRVERARRSRDDGSNRGAETDLSARDADDNRSAAARLRDAAAPQRESVSGWLGGLFR